MSQWALYLSGGTPFGAVRHQRGKSHRRWLIQQEGKRRNDSAVKIVLTFPAAPPFGGCATTFPPKRGHHGCWEVCHIHPIKKRRRKAPHHNLLNPPAEGGQNPLNPLNPGRLWRPFGL